MPTTTKKNKSKKTQSSFTSPDKIATGIRKVMHEPYGNPGDKTMPARLLLAVSDWLKSPDPEAYSATLSEFSFTDPGHSFKEIWKVALEIDHLYDGDMVVKFPSIYPLEKIIFPAGADYAFCFGKLGIVDVLTGKAICVTNFMTGFKFKNIRSQEEIFRLKATKNKGNLTVIRITLSFYRYDDKHHSVAMGESSGFVAAIYRK